MCRFARFSPLPKHPTDFAPFWGLSDPAQSVGYFDLKEYYRRYKPETCPEAGDRYRLHPSKPLKCLDLDGGAALPANLATGEKNLPRAESLKQCS